MIDGSQFIELAGKLAASAGADEVTYRSSVSRAYYGTFHIAFAFLEQLGIPIPANANAHAAIQRYLIGSDHPEARQAGMILASLHGDRIKADYRLDDPRFQKVQFARMRVALAHDFVSTLAACRTDEAKAAIKAGIDEYRMKIGEA